MASASVVSGGVYPLVTEKKVKSQKMRMSIILPVSVRGVAKVVGRWHIPLTTIGFQTHRHHQLQQAPQGHQSDAQWGQPDALMGQYNALMGQPNAPQGPPNAPVDQTIAQTGRQ